MAVTREKIAELFYQDPPEFNLAQDSDAVHDWIGAVGWAALRLGSKRDYKHALKLLKPFLKKIYWARIWSVHFAERLKLKRTLSELLTLTITTDECIREVATTRRSLLSILQNEPHGIKVISA